MSDRDDSAERTPESDMPEWPQPIESTDAPDDDNERPPDATAEQHWASFPTQPSTRHPRTGKPTSHYVEYVDLRGNTARFDLDRLKTWPRPGRDWWFGQGQRDDEILCRVIPAAGGAARWVLIYVTLEEGDESTFTLTELESFEWGKNPYGGGPTDRELTPDETAEWLERNEYQLPDDLDLTRPFDPSTPPSGRLARDWVPPPAESPNGNSATTHVPQVVAPTAPRPAVERGDLENHAVVLLLKHPDWTNKRIAKELECHPKSLSRFKRFRQARRVAASAHDDLPRGRKDGETGNIEAWDDR